MTCYFSEHGFYFRVQFVTGFWLERWAWVVFYLCLIVFMKS